MLEQGAIDMVTFTSSSTVENFAGMFERDDEQLQQWMGPVTVALVSERKLGFFVKVKEDQNFNRRNICNILRIKIFSDAEIDEKDSFRSGTI